MFVIKLDGPSEWRESSETFDLRAAKEAGLAERRAGLEWPGGSIRPAPLPLAVHVVDLILPGTTGCETEITVVPRGTLPG